MADNFKEQINQAQKLNQLTQERIDKEKKFTDSTLKDRVKILDDIVSNQDDLNKLHELEKDVATKVNKLHKTGHTELGKKYKVEQKIIAGKKQELLLQKNANSLLEASDTLLEGMIGKAKEFGEELTKPGGKLKVTLVGIVGILTAFSSNVDSIGDSFGAIGVQTGDISNDLMTSNVEARRLGMNMQDVVTATNALTKEFGIGFNEARELSSEVLDLSKGLGVSVEEGANLIGVLRTTAGLTTKQAANLSKQVTLLSAANDVAPQAVLQDIASSTEDIAGFTDSTGENIARAAIQARKLGLNLSDVAASARKMLDFESALEASLNAQIMTGKQINIQKIQEAALSGDLEKLQQEQLKQLGSAEEFNKMNVLQKEALANAVGLELSQASKLVNKEGERTTIAGELSKQKGMDELLGENAISNLTMILNNFKSIGASITQAIGPSLNAVVGIIGMIASGLGSLESNFGVISGLAATFATKSLLGAVATIFKSFGMTPFGLGIPLAVGAVAALYSSLSKAKSKKMAEGGIVKPTPGGTLATIGEAGEAEAVIPLSRMGEMGFQQGGGGNSQAVVSAINSLKSEMVAVKQTIQQLNLKTSISNNELNVALTPQLTS